MGNVNPLYDVGTFRVSTKLGKKKVVARPLTKSGAVIFLTRPYKIGRGEKGVSFPIGTPIVKNHELARRTNNRVTHAIVEGGLYHLVRQMEHIASGSERDLAGMIVTAEDLRQCVDFIRMSGQLPLDYHERVAEFLTEIGESLDIPKRNEHKLNSAKRSKQAASTRYKDQRIKPGPGHFVAKAAALHAVKRIRELQDICPAVSYTMIRTHQLMRRIHGILDRIWHYFTGKLIEELPVPVHTAMERSSRNWPGVKITARDIEEFEVLMLELFLQPFTGLAARLRTAFRKLRDAIYRHRRDYVLEQVRIIRILLRRLRMIRYVELKLLPHLGRGSSSESGALLAKHARFMARLEDMKDDELDRELRRESMDYLELFREDYENGEPRDAKTHLKALSGRLASAS